MLRTSHLPLLSTLLLATLTTCSTAPEPDFNPDGSKIKKEKEVTPQITTATPAYAYREVYLDSCQYIEVNRHENTRSHVYSLTHKGNCKNTFHRKVWKPQQF